VKLRTAAFFGQQLSLHSSFPYTASHRQPKQTGPKNLKPPPYTVNHRGTTLRGQKSKAPVGIALFLKYLENILLSENTEVLSTLRWLDAIVVSKLKYSPKLWFFC
jgi:hypothetical protein